VTGPEHGQGTVSVVAIVMYGDKGHSDPILIGEDKSFQFEEGKTDEFEVDDTLFIQNFFYIFSRNRGNMY